MNNYDSYFFDALEELSDVEVINTTTLLATVEGFDEKVLFRNVDGCLYATYNKRTWLVTVK